MTLQRRLRLPALRLGRDACRRLQQPTCVAPMVDVTDPPFLYLLRTISPHPHHQLYSEMIHANAFSRGRLTHDIKALHQHVFVSDPHLRTSMAVQLGGNEERDLAIAAGYLATLRIPEINLNVGCPSKNVQSGSFGAVLMKSPETVARVCRAMIDAVEGKTRITVKCRIGIDDVESFEFVSRFVEIIAANAGVDHFIIHARRAWLKGLSPRRNLTVPPLNYPIVYRLAEAYPDLKFVINGGIADIPSVVEHLGRVDGVMLGRKVRDDAWFLADMDQHIYGVPQSAIPSLDSVLASYLAWADETQIKLGTRETILARPLNSLFRGSQGRVFRRHIGSLLTKATSSREESKAGHPRVMFSEITNEALVGAQSECSAKLLSHAKDASSLEPEMTVHAVEAAEA